MNKLSPRRGRAALIAKVSCLLALVACVCALSLTNAIADTKALAFSYEGGVRTYYYSIQEALEAGYAGKTVYMACDWEINSTIEIADSKSLTINMDGHAIRYTKTRGSEMILVNKNASLTLTSATKKTFGYTGYDSSGERQGYSIETGGLITGGNSSYCGGVRMLASSSLTLDNVALAGNRGTTTGAIDTKGNCTVNINNGASVEANSGEKGAVFANGDDVTINMDGGKISRNLADGKKGGGAIHSAGSATRIHMTNGAMISENYAKNGGGVYFEYSYFGIYSSDKTGSITGNRTFGTGDDGYGGGVYAESCNWHLCEGALQGVNFTNNVAKNGGGGVFLKQKWTRVIDCTFTGNQAEAGRGGGVFVSNSDISLEGCTVTGNYCSGSAEGGGVLVDSQFDVKITGKTTIINNTRGEGGSKDDLLLQNTAMTTAYMTGGASEGSKIGVRTSSEGERRFGKNIDTYTDGTYFIDLDGYYVTHGTDAGGDLWQRKSADIKFVLKLNGTELGLYKYDEAVSVNGNTSDDDKVFWYWDTEHTTGLYPIEQYINDANRYSPFLTFAMPQNTVSVMAVYADAVTSGKFSVEAPVPGQVLPATATFQRTDSGSGPSEEIPNIAVTWYEVDVDGNKTPATGKAKYDTTYVAEFSIQKQRYNGVAFSRSITRQDVVVSVSGESQSSSSAAVSESTGTLTVQSWGYTTDKPAVKAIAKTYMTAPVGTSTRELETMLPSKATVHLEDGSSVVVGTDTSGRINWPEGLFDSSGHVKNPEGSTILLNMELPLKENPAVPGIENRTVTVEITVNSAGVVGAPQLTPAGGASTYNRYWGETRLDDNLVLTINATCVTTGASIKYKVDGGDAQLTNNGEIRLQGTASQIVEHNIVVWAEKYVGGALLKSQEVSGTYYLDDTVQKQITVNCADTGSYDSSAAAWTSSFTVTGDLGLKTTVTAPAQENRIFSHWEWEGAPEGTDLNSSTLTIGSFSLDLNNKIRAVYIPCITTIDVGTDAVAAHEVLADSASYVKVGVGTDADDDITGCFAKGAQLTWSPLSGTDGAAHSTAYSAYLQWNSGANSAQYALADNVKLLLNGESVEGAAICQAAGDNGTFLCVTFPETAGLTVSKVASVADLDLTYEDAYSYQAATDAGRTTSWGLPGEVQVDYACGEKGSAYIEWDVPETFDAGNVSAQTLTATGTLIYDGDVNADAAPKTITATINVSAAEVVAAPTASVAAGTYDQAQSVELACATEGATIRYTTDGTQPTEKSAKYDGAIEVASTTTIKARAFCDGMAASDVAAYSYTIKAASCTVTFDSAGGSAVDAQVVEKGETATQPTAPTLEGFSFEYWADASGVPYDFTAPVTSDITLYAHWAKSSRPVVACLVRFDSAGGSAVAAQTVTAGSCAVRPADPTREGYTFDGWYTQDGEAYDFAQAIEADMTLVAHWTAARAAAHTVAFDSAGGSAVASQTVDDGGVATEPAAPTFDGYTFVGWFTEGGEAYDFKTSVTTDVTLYAHWAASGETPVPCLVVFDSAGGSAVDAQTVAAGSCASRPADPTHGGFAFEGWYTQDGAEFDFAQAIVADTTLCAHWSASPEPVAFCTVTFDSAGGSAVASQVVAAGELAVMPDAPTLDGFLFECWVDAEGEVYAFTEPVNSSITLYARWIAGTDPVAACLVVFDSAGGSSVGAQTVVSGDAVAEPAAPTREGYTFDGWYTQAGDKYDFKAPVTSDLTLFAHWSKNGQPVATHTVTFDSAGGSAVASQAVADGGVATEPAAPTREGYTFDGWYTQAGDKYDFKTPVTADVALLAKWQRGSAAPEGDASGETPGNTPGNTTGGASAAASGSKAATVPATGDGSCAQLAAAGLLGVLGATVLAAGAASRRRDR